MHRLLLSLFILTSSFAWSQTKQPVTLLIWFGGLNNLTHHEFDIYTAEKQATLPGPIRPVFIAANEDPQTALAAITKSVAGDDEITGLLIASDGESKRSKNLLRAAVPSLKSKWAKDLVAFLDVCATTCDVSFGIRARAEDLYVDLRVAGVETLWTWSASNDFVTARDMTVQAAILSLITSADIGVMTYSLTASPWRTLFSAIITWPVSMKLAQWMLVGTPMPPSGTLVKIHGDDVTNVQVDASQLDMKTFPECVKLLVN